MNREQLISILTKLAVPREDYFISGFEKALPRENQLCLVRTKNNPYRTSLWQTFYIERGQMVSINLFQAEEAAVGMLASDVIGSIPGEHFCPVNTCLTLFFYVFAKLWMSIEKLDFRFDESDIRSPSSLLGKCGRLTMKIDCSEEKLDVNLSADQDNRYRAILQTTIETPALASNPLGAVKFGSSQLDRNGMKWHMFRETFLPAFRTIVTKYIPRDRFVTRDV